MLIFWESGVSESFIVKSIIFFLSKFWKLFTSAELPYCSLIAAGANGKFKDNCTPALTDAGLEAGHHVTVKTELDIIYELKISNARDNHTECWSAMVSLCSMIKFISLMFVRIKVYILNVKLICKDQSIGNLVGI